MHNKFESRYVYLVLGVFSICLAVLIILLTYRDLASITNNFRLDVQGTWPAGITKFSAASLIFFYGIKSITTFLSGGK